MPLSISRRTRASSSSSLAWLMAVPMGRNAKAARLMYTSDLPRSHNCSVTSADGGRHREDQWLVADLVGGGPARRRVHRAERFGGVERGPQHVEVAWSAEPVHAFGGQGEAHAAGDFVGGRVRLVPRGRPSLVGRL